MIIFMVDQARQVFQDTLSSIHPMVIAVKKESFKVPMHSDTRQLFMVN